MNTNLNMQTLPIDRLRPAKYNPRKDLKPGDPAYEQIKRSLHDFGYVDGIYVGCSLFYQDTDGFDEMRVINNLPFQCQ